MYDDNDYAILGVFLYCVMIGAVFWATAGGVVYLAYRVYHWLL